MAIKAAELSVVVGADTNAAVTGIQGALGTVQQAGANMLGYLSAHVFTQMISGFADLGRQAFESVASFESLGMTMQTLVARELRNTSEGALSMGDALEQAGGQTEELLQWLEELAIQSPYASSQVSESFKGLMQYGFPIEQAKDMTQAILDMGAGSGMTAEQLGATSYALGQINLSDKLLMQDLRQLMNAGVDVNAILEEMGYDLGDVGTEAISSSDFLAKFVEVSERDFGGAVDRMAGSWQGLTGALGDMKEIGLREFFGGAFEALKPLVQSLTDWLMGEGRAQLQEWGASFGELVSKIVELGAAWAGNWGGIRDTLTTVWSGTIQPALEMLGEWLQVNIPKAVEWLKTAWAGNWEEIQGKSQGIISSISSVIQQFIISFQTWWSENGATITAAVMTAWEVLKGIFNSAIAVIGPAVQGLIENIKSSFSRMGPLVDAFKKLWTSLKPVITVVLEILGAVILAFVGVVVGLFKGISKAIGPFITGIIGIVTGFATALSGVFDIVVGLVEMVVAIFRGDGEAIRAAVEKMKNGVINLFSGLVTIVVSLVTGLWNTLKGLITGLVSGIIEFFTNLYNKLVGHSLIPDLINKIIDWFTSLPKKLMEPLSTIINRITSLFTNTNWGDLGHKIISGLVDALHNGIASVISAAGDVASAVLETFKGFFGIHSPSTLFEEIGENVVLGLMNGLQSKPIDVGIDNMLRQRLPTAQQVANHYTYNTYNLAYQTSQTSLGVASDIKLLELLRG